MASPAALALLPESWTIRHVTSENRDTFTLELSPPSPSTFRFLPGQFNMLYVPGHGEVAISISGDPGDRDHLTHTVRAVGSVTAALQTFRPGAQVGVRGPFGSAWPTDVALTSHAILVAGGIGLAPLRPLVYTLAAMAEQRHVLGLRTHLCYGARSPSERIFRDQLEHWARLPGFDVASIVDQADRSWRGPVGVVTNLMTDPPPDPLRTVAFACGPEVMMRFSALKLAGLGLPSSRQFVSTERNMKCAIGYCGHCQFGPHFVCKDGPVFAYDRVEPLLRTREI